VKKITNYHFKDQDVHLEMGHESLIVSYAVFLKYQLKIGMDITPQLEQAINLDLLFDRLYKEAKIFLKKIRTSYEVKQHLLKSTSNSQVIIQVIDTLKTKKYVDDHDYIKRYMQSHPHYGPNKVMFELIKKGIKKEDLYVHLNDMDISLKLQHIIDHCLLKNQTLSHHKKILKCSLYAKQLGYEPHDIQDYLSHKEMNMQDELSSIKIFFVKTQKKLKGDIKEQCQTWIKKAMQQGFSYENAKLFCKELEHDTIL
jgi:regulatory protein